VEVDFEGGSIIDDFLPPKEYDEIYRAIRNKDFPYGFSAQVNDKQVNKFDYYFANMVYQRDMPNSPIAPLLMNIFIPKLIELDVFTSLMRIKVNCYPYTDVLKEHEPHTDQDFFVKGAIFSINTCNGFTRYKDKKVDSIKNRMFFFDSSAPHNSTTTSDSKARFNINFNFL
tara:strand:- start:789 stop:1301 length:513 start_codon:yes stop_codon:yes gene_type:complete